MSLRLTKIAAILLAASVATPVLAGGYLAAPEPPQLSKARCMLNWYFSGFGGASHLDNYDDLWPLRNKFKVGYDLGGAIGLRWGPLRVEEQYTFLSHNLNNIYDAKARASFLDLGIKFDGRQKLHTAMTNVIYDFRVPSDVVGLYIGGGLGWSRAVYDANSIQTLANNSIVHRFYGFKQNRMAYQGLAGITVNTDNQFVVDFGYRYLATNRLVNTFSRLHYHLWNAGITYHVPA